MPEGNVGATMDKAEGEDLRNCGLDVSSTQVTTKLAEKPKRPDPDFGTGADNPVEDLEDTLRRPVAAPPQPGVVEKAADGFTERAGDSGAHDGAGSGFPLLRQLGSLKDAAQTHPLATGVLVVLFVVVAAFLAIAFSKTALVPTEAAIIADVEAMVQTPEYSGGDFGSDAHLVLREVEVRSVSRTSSAIDSSAAPFGASGYASAEIYVVFSNNSVTAEKTFTLGYALVDKVWEPIGEETDVRVAFTASEGVSENKITDHIDDVLLQAENSYQSTDNTGAARDITLAELYDGAEITISSHSFDEAAQSDTLTLLCSNTSLYESYYATLTLSFSFSPVTGSWTEDSIRVSADAKTRNFDALVGSWSGTFQSQSSENTRCLGAKDSQLSITITEAGGAAGVSWLKGTVTGLAHYHSYPDEDSSAEEGDEVFQDVAFTATFVGGYNQDTDSELAFIATLPEDINGTVTLTLGFGTQEMASQVVASVKTTYPYTESFLFITTEKSAVYTDLFILEKAD